MKTEDPRTCSLYLWHIGYFKKCEFLSSFEILYGTPMYKIDKRGTALSEAGVGNILTSLWSLWGVFRKPSSWFDVTWASDVVE